MAKKTHVTFSALKTEIFHFKTEPPVSNRPSEEMTQDIHDMKYVAGIQTG
jgi:hypothetical protein